MRRNLFVLTAGLLVVGVSSATLVRADERAATKGSAVAFRLASTTPADGFQQMKTDGGETIYVSPRVTFTSDEVVSALHGKVRGDLDLALTPDALERIDRTAGELVAVVVDGKVASTALIANVGRESVSISGLGERELTRVSTLLGVGSAYGPVIRLVPRQAFAKPGSTVTVDAFITGAPDLRVYQVAVDAVGGRTGTMTRQPGHIDEAREDYVFGSAQSIKAVDDTRGRFGSVLFDGSINATNQSYLGSMDYKLSEDATGTFIFKVRFDEDSFILDGNSEYVQFTPINATIKVGGAGARTGR